MKQLSATELKVTQKVSASNENGSASRRQEAVSHTRTAPSVQQAAKAKSRGKTIDLPLNSQQLKNVRTNRTKGRK